MPAETRGSVFTTRDGYGIRWPENGKRPQQTGFTTKTEARRWFAEQRRAEAAHAAHRRADDHLRRVLRPLPRAARRDRRRRGRRTTLDERLAASRDAVRRLAARASSRAPPPTSPPGGRALRHVALPADARRCGRRSAPPSAGATSPATRPSRRAATRSRAPRSCCRSLARRSTRSPSSSARAYGPLVVFAAETGLRTNEWVGARAPRRRPRRARRHRPAPRTPTASLTAVPEDGALAAPRPAHHASARRARGAPAAARHAAAVPRRPRAATSSLDNWRTREWYPALEAAGIAQARPVPPAPHVRDRGARRRRLDLRAVAR